MIPKTIALIILASTATSARSQDSLEVAKTLNAMERMFHSDSSQLILDLREVPFNILKRIQFLSDSIYYSLPYNADRKSQAIQPDIMSFMANRKEDWTCCDHISDPLLPRRKFTVAVQSGDWYIIFYERGGMTIDILVVYANRNDAEHLSGFGTSMKTRHLLFEIGSKEKKLVNFKKMAIDRLADPHDVRVLHGKVPGRGTWPPEGL